MSLFVSRKWSSGFLDNTFIFILIKTQKKHILSSKSEKKTSVVYLPNYATSNISHQSKHNLTRQWQKIRKYLVGYSINTTNQLRNMNKISPKELYEIQTELDTRGSKHQ